MPTDGSKPIVKHFTAASLNAYRDTVRRASACDLGSILLQLRWKPFHTWVETFAHPGEKGYKITGTV